MKSIACSILAIALPAAPAFAVETPPSAQPMIVAASNSGPVYADGTYTGPSEDAYYGRVQMQVTIKGGKIAGFNLLDFPRHTGTSIEINRQALPMLANEVVTAQSANVNIISGATLTSEAFIRSLGAAFDQARQAAGGN
ncbi:MAG TPA: FMN-binding protein [Devosiaceae bacterium]